MTTNQIRERIGNPQQFLDERAAYRRSAAYLSDNWRDLLARFPNEYVAAFDGALAAHAPSIPELMDALDSQSILRAHTAVRFMRDSDDVLLLSCR